MHGPELALRPAIASAEYNAIAVTQLRAAPPMSVMNSRRLMGSHAKAKDHRIRGN